MRSIIRICWTLMTSSCPIRHWVCTLSPKYWLRTLLEETYWRTAGSPYRKTQPCSRNMMTILAFLSASKTMRYSIVKYLMTTDQALARRKWLCKRINSTRRSKTLDYEWKRIRKLCKKTLFSAKRQSRTGKRSFHIWIRQQVSSSMSSSKLRIKNLRCLHLYSSSIAQCMYMHPGLTIIGCHRRSNSKNLRLQGVKIGFKLI